MFSILPVLYLSKLIYLNYASAQACPITPTRSTDAHSPGRKKDSRPRSARATYQRRYLWAWVVGAFILTSGYIPFTYLIGAGIAWLGVQAPKNLVEIYTWTRNAGTNIPRGREGWLGMQPLTYLVADVLGEFNGITRHSFLDIGIEERCRSDLYHLLIATLYGAVPLMQVNHITVPIT